MSKPTTSTSTIEITVATPTLMLAMELSEAKWKLGFSAAFGQAPLVRNVAARDGAKLLAQIAWARKQLGLPPTARIVSCYEAGREGFWLHRFLVANGVDNSRSAKGVDGEADIEGGAAVHQGANLPAMAQASPKDRILEALRDLPADASIDDAIERLVFLARIDEGLAELDAGEGIPHEEVRRRFGA